MNPTAASILLLAGLALPASLALAADDTVDLQSRGGVSLALNLPGRWRSELAYENRRFEDLSEFRGHYFTVEGGYRLTKHLDLLANYRLAKGADWTSHRYGFGLEYERKAGGFTLGFRPIFQYRTKATDDDDTGGDGDSFLRTRLQAQYGLTRRFDVYGSVEPYFAFGADYPVDNWKDTLGVRYELTKHARVDLYYIYRPDYGKSYNRTFHVVGFELRFKAKVPAR
jgi:hypothetical protein